MMNRKCFSLFLIILISLIAVSAVSAADDNATDVVSLDENDEVALPENSDEATLNVENENSELSVDSVASADNEDGLDDTEVSETNGDAAVYGNGVITSENVTNDTFYNFFDESGVLKDEVTYDELIFQGSFSDLVDVITFNRPITVTAQKANLDYIAIRIASDDVKLSGLTLYSENKEFGDNNGALIYATGSDIELDNLNVRYIVPDEVEAIAVYANAANNFRLTNSSITLQSTNPGSKHNYGLEVRDSENVLIESNLIRADLPNVGVAYGAGNGIDLDLVLDVGIQGGKNINFTNNTVVTYTKGIYGSYPTADAVMIHSVDNLLVNSNTIFLFDQSDSDSPRYHYGLDIYSANATVENNEIRVATKFAGVAYPVQLTGPFRITVSNNNLSANSEGSSAGIYASNWNGYGDLTATYNNIDILGSVFAGTYDLISGIEAEIDVARVYNNTIEARNLQLYEDSHPVYGIGMTSEYVSGDVVADIKDNNITVEGKYAVYYVKASNTNVTGNTLYAHDLDGNGAVFIGSGENNIVKDNLPKHIVTNDTFYNFFDESGVLKDEIHYGELIFQGQFSNLVDVITFNRPIVATTEDAVLNDIAIRIAGDDVKLSGFRLNSYVEHADNNGALIYATGSDIEINNVSIRYDAPSEVEAIAVYANAANNFRLTNSTILYESINPGSKHNYGLEVRDSENVLIENNYISAILPAVAVAYGAGNGIDIDLVLAVGIQGGKDINFTKNSVDTAVIASSFGYYPTVDDIMIHSVDNVLINLNEIRHIELTTSDDTRYYYNVDIHNTTGTVEYNEIYLNYNSETDKSSGAYNVQLSGPFTVTVSNNNLTVTSSCFAVGIYASNWNGYGNLTAIDNNIEVYGSTAAEASAVLAGIEAEIDVARVYNNIIKVFDRADYNDSNPAYGIGMASEYVSGDVVADIKDNKINNVLGKYAVYYVKASNTNVIGNTLYAHRLKGDEAVFIGSGENNVVKDNLPITIIATALSGADLEMTYKDGSAWTATLTDANGAAVAGAAVKVAIKTKVYTILTDENGAVSLPVNLIAGTYAINATFEGNDHYEASFVNATIIVNQATATLSADDLEMKYKDGSCWAVTLTDPNGEAVAGVKVAFGISGKTYNISTDDAGVAKLTINLQPGIYDINASFSNAQYKADLITATITVNKNVPTLTAEDLVMTYKDGSTWDVTLKDASGNAMNNTVIKFTIKDTTYTIRTNEDGVASLAINLAAGNYTATAKYVGSKYLEAVEINNTVVVNQPDYDIVADDVNMTYQDGTSYNVQLTDGEGNPVAQENLVIKITINGKSYDRKTNADGIASLVIGLKAGTHTVTAEYNGKQITNTIVVN